MIELPNGKCEFVTILTKNKTKENIKMKNKNGFARTKTLYFTTAGMIAALYVALTLLSNAFNLSSGAIQCRLSEALCVLPIFTPAAIPGLTIGCVIANLITTGNIVDVIFGSLATLIGAVGALWFKKHRHLASIPTILANTLIIPFVLKFMLHLEESVWFFFITIFIGELISAGILGAIVVGAVERVQKKNNKA